MARKNLTSKQQAYVDARLSGLKKRDAALAAGYSHAGADVQAANLEKHPGVKAAITKGRRAAGVTVTTSTHSTLGVDPNDKRLRDHYDSPLDLFLHVMNNPKFPDGTRIESAKLAAPFMHARLTDAGKKHKKVERAKELSKVGTGRAPIAPPTRTRMN